MDFTVKEVAQNLIKNEETIKRWIRKGTFPNAYKDKGNKWFIPNQDLKPFENTNDIHLVEMRSNLLGKKFGYLTIVDVIGYRKEGSNNRLFVCVGCDCGNVAEKPFYLIEAGKIVRCSNECILKSNFQHGDSYGFLTIISDEGVQQYGNKKKRFVKAKCECGNVIIKPLIKIKNGSYRSCGKGCKMWLTDIIGNKHGFLTVLDEMEKKNNKRYFLCQCDCGEVREKSYSKLIGEHTKFCGHGCVLKRGESHPSWNPDLSMEDRIKGRDYWEYKQWEKAVKIHDEFSCQNPKCGKVGGDLISHHLDGYDWCIERRTDATNGKTLCVKCHNHFHAVFGYGGNTEQQFTDWINLPPPYCIWNDEQITYLGQAHDIKQLGLRVAEHHSI